MSLKAPLVLLISEADWFMGGMPDMRMQAPVIKLYPC